MEYLPMGTAINLSETPEMPPVKPPKETVNHPAHYQGKYECIDEMIALFGVEAVKAFCRCNVYKYRYRADRKNGEEDIKKAEWYMSKLIELEGTNAKEYIVQLNKFRSMIDSVE